MRLRFWSDARHKFELPLEVEDESADFPDPQESPLCDLSLFDGLMLATFGGASEPHQLIVFGYIKLLQWKPAEVFEELSHESLKTLMARLERDLQDFFAPHDWIVRESLKKLKELVQNGTGVGATLLRDNYTSKAALGTRSYSAKCRQNITNWWVSVERRVKSDLAKKGGAF
ncbi:MAG: hypothetical protein C5B50_28615 [Verrucomicrobia bacterium]|nr:MAG: hypothetical protein C5B50_28615 [Verrucomicrobiota bacterium]